jgi:flagellar capping protein FliD
MGVDTMSNETVTYSLEAVLTRIEGKIDNLQKDFNQKFDKIDERLNKLEVGQAKLTEKVEGIDNRLKSVEGTQKNQVWTLIILLASAIAVAFLTTFSKI